MIILYLILRFAVIYYLSVGVLTAQKMSKKVFKIV